MCYRSAVLGPVVVWRAPVILPTDIEVWEALPWPQDAGPIPNNCIVCSTQAGLTVLGGMFDGFLHDDPSFHAWEFMRRFYSAFVMLEGYCFRHHKYLSHLGSLMIERAGDMCYQDTCKGLSHPWASMWRAWAIFPAPSPSPSAM